jgi:hypothetical protein
LKLFNSLKRNPIILLIIGFFIFSCSENKIQDDDIIAKVGDRVITAKDFATSFELSFAPFRQSENPRKTYLNYMINELLIANQGFSLGFNEKAYVTSRVNNRLNNNLLQSFYTEYVHDKVKIPDSDIEEATKKATVKFRMMIWPTSTIDKAEAAYDEASKTDLKDYVNKQISKMEIPNVTQKTFETDWLDYLDLRPELLAEIQNLEIGKPSKPIPYKDGYAIFQVISINRKPIKLDELKYGQRRKRIKARLFNIESDKIVHQVMDSLLTPLDVRAKSKTIDQMVLPLFKWVKAGIPDSNSIVGFLNSATDTSQSYILKLKELLPEILYTTTDGRYTVEDYFNYMNYHRRIINLSQTPVDLKNRLITEIGNMIKNTAFINIAEKDGYKDSVNIVNDMKLWEQKWTYELFREELVKDIIVSDEEMEDYFENRWKELPISNIDTTRFYKYKDDVYNALLFEKQTALLNEELTKLKEKYPVWINEEALSKLKLDDTPKSLETSLFVVKNFSGEKIIPDVDMSWLHF